jgi:hypothetical protein
MNKFKATLFQQPVSDDHSKLAQELKKHSYFSGVMLEERSITFSSSYSTAIKTMIAFKETANNVYQGLHFCYDLQLEGF